MKLEYFSVLNIIFAIENSDFDLSDISDSASNSKSERAVSVLKFIRRQ
jgi:hypothetical protein